MNKQDIIMDIIKTDEDGNNYVDSTYRNGELVSSTNKEY